MLYFAFLINEGKEFREKVKQILMKKYKCSDEVLNHLGKASKVGGK